MLVSVTTLGSRTGDAAGAAGAVIEYLDGRSVGKRGPERAGPNAPEPPDLPETEGPGAYYADSVEGPGTWVGHGINGATMNGTVDPAELRRLLLAQDPRTGTQLRPINTRSPSSPLSGRALSTAEAAEAMGVSAQYLRRVLNESRTAEATRLGQLLAGTALSPLPTSYLPASRSERGGYLINSTDLATWQRGRNAQTVVVGYDVTFSAPKSVSILWAAGERHVQAEVLAAIDASVAAGVTYLEQHGAHVRTKRERLPADGVLGASYLHGTSRALDPQLHRHVVVGNVAAAPDGTVLALDGTSLYAHAKTAGYIAASELRSQLTDRLGVEWHDVVNGLADIAGIPTEAIQAMSTRAADIERAAAELGATSAAARQVAAWTTRTAKDRSVDPAALRPWWRERLDEAGFDANALGRTLDRIAPAPLTPRDEIALLDRLAGPSGVTERANSFDRRDVVQWIAANSPQALPAERISTLADAWLASGAVSLDPEGATPRSVWAAGTTLYTTPEMLALEQRVGDRYSAGLGSGRAAVPREIAAAAVAGRPGLGRDQVALVLGLTTSGHTAQCAVGPAGTGKTYALEVAAAAWDQAGFRVIGAAVQGTAAEVLGRATGVPSSTIASLLTRLDTAQPGHGPLDDQTVLLVDEASTIGNRDLDRLLAHVDAAGAAVRLIGDPAQHSAVAAGGAWRWLVDHHADVAPRLEELRRQAGPDLEEVRLALTDYRDGHIAEAIERLDRDDRVVTADNADELLDHLVADWYVDRRLTAAEGAPTSSMVAEHHAERRELNRRARALLTADGTLRGPTLNAAGTLLQAGDEVIARRPDKTLRPEGGDRHSHVRNGTRGRVVGVDVDARSVSVDFDGRGPIEVPWAYLTAPLRPGVTGGLAHSYALTSHAAQGETYRAGRHLASDRSTRKAVYVGLTRGQADVRLYTVRHGDLHPEPVDDDLPRITDNTPTIDAITRRLADGGDEHLARELDPLAAALPAALADTPLAELVARRAADPLAAAAVRLATRRVGDLALNEPPAELVERLGVRPAGGPARRFWDDAVRADAIERAGLPVTGEQSAAALGAIAESRTLAATPPRLLLALHSTAGEDRRDAIGAALEAQAQVAAHRPAQYLIDLLGAPGGAAWEQSAIAVERYRHCVLGMSPDDGAVGDTALGAAIGQRPDGALGRRWDATARGLAPVTPAPVSTSMQLEL